MERQFHVCEEGRCGVAQSTTNFPGKWCVFMEMNGEMTLQYIGKGSHANGDGLYHRGYYGVTEGKRKWGTTKAKPDSMKDARVICYYKGFEGPQANHAEMYFLSVFGTPINKFIEGGLGVTEDGYGGGAWGAFYPGAVRKDVVEYIKEEIPSMDMFFNYPNYHHAPSIIRRTQKCDDDLKECIAQYNTLRELYNALREQYNAVRGQNNALHEQYNTLSVKYKDLVDENSFLASGLVLSMNYMTSSGKDAFLSQNGPGLQAVSEDFSKWWEADKSKNGNNGSNGNGGDGGNNGNPGKGDGDKCICPKYTPAVCPTPVACSLDMIDVTADGISINGALVSPLPLGACNYIQSNLTLCTNNIKITNGYLDNCRKDKDKVTLELETCQKNKNTVTLDLGSCKNNKNTVTSDLGTCKKQKEETQGILTKCQTDYRNHLERCQKGDKVTESTLEKCQRDFTVLEDKYWDLKTKSDPGMSFARHKVYVAK